MKTRDIFLKKADVKQRMMAKKMGVSPQAVYFFLNKPIDSCSVGTLKKYAKIAGIKFHIERAFT